MIRNKEAILFLFSVSLSAFMLGAVALLTVYRSAALVLLCFDTAFLCYLETCRSLTEEEN
jgi:hypothetical protein